GRGRGARADEAGVGGQAGRLRAGGALRAEDVHDGGGDGDTDPVGPGRRGGQPPVVGVAVEPGLEDERPLVAHGHGAPDPVVAGEVVRVVVRLEPAGPAVRLVVPLPRRRDRLALGRLVADGRAAGRGVAAGVVVARDEVVRVVVRLEPAGPAVRLVVPLPRRRERLALGRLVADGRAAGRRVAGRVVVDGDEQVAAVPLRRLDGVDDPHDVAHGVDVVGDPLGGLAGELLLARRAGG